MKTTVRLTKILVSTLLTVTSAICLAQTKMGGSNGGGGDPSAVTAGAIRLLINGDGLKNAMQNYINTLPLSQIEDGQVRTLFQTLMQNNKLKQDIINSKYAEATEAKPCEDAYNEAVSASTEVGKPGAEICFDIKKLAKSFGSLTEEELMVKLASLAFHEHVHHFQEFSKEKIKQNENEANRISGYILLTARFVQLPVLKWTKPSQDSNDFQSIQNLMSLLTAKEQVFLSPAESDYLQYPSYKGQSDRGIIRLLPREKYDRKLVTRGGGAYYSFSRLSHDHSYGTDVSLDDRRLNVGFAGCDFGFYINLGNTPIESIKLDRPELDLILNFQPAFENEPEVRKQQRLFGHSREEEPVIRNGLKYSNRIIPVVGNTYALRSINYNESDLAALLHVVRQDTDGSLIIVWKKLKSFPVHSCSK